MTPHVAPFLMLKLCTEIVIRFYSSPLLLYVKNSLADQQGLHVVLRVYGTWG